MEVLEISFLTLYSIGILRRMIQIHPTQFLQRLQKNIFGFVKKGILLIVKLINFQPIRNVQYVVIRNFYLALMIYKLVIQKLLKIGVRKTQKLLLSIYVALENLYFGNVIFVTMSGRLLFGIELVLARDVLTAREKR